MFFNFCCQRRNWQNNCCCNNCRQERNCCHNDCKQERRCDCQRENNCRRQPCCNCRDWSWQNNDINWGGSNGFNQNFSQFQRGGCSGWAEPIFYDNRSSSFGNGCQGLTFLNETPNDEL